MSGDIHSGVQEVILPDTDEQKNVDVEESKSMTKDEENKENMEEIGKNGTYIASGIASLCCEVCNIKVTSAKILQRHLEGRRHKSRTERKGKNFYCELCDLTANSEIQLNIHLSSSKHKAKIAKEEHKEFTDISTYSTSIYILLFCGFCIFLNFVILIKLSF